MTDAELAQSLSRAAIEGSQGSGMELVSRWKPFWPAPMRRWLASRADSPLSAADSAGESPLALALLHGREDLSLCLINAGARIAGSDRSGLIPLARAAQKDLPRPCEALLALGADPDGHSADGSSPLAHASARCAAILLRFGAHPGKPDARGASPLHSAASRGDHALCMLLLQAGADPCACDADGGTPLLRACLFGDESCAADLASACPAALNAPDRHGATPLGACSRHGRASIAAKLLAMGADPNMLPQSPGASTPLCIACSCGRGDIAELLLQYGADLNKPDSLGRSPSMLAASGGHAHCSGLLLAHGARQHVNASRRP